MVNGIIKICGIRDAQLAYQAVKHGADLVGIVFHSLSPRYVAIDEAKIIADAVISAGGCPVAVFVNHTNIEMQRICEATNIKTVQLHGDISRAHHHLLPEEYKRIYAISINKEGLINIDKGMTYLDTGRDLILIDHYQPGQGVKLDLSKFNYDLAFPWILAGGLTTSNVSSAIKTCQPHGVDVSSGVESERGKKDILLIQRFIKCVQDTYEVKRASIPSMGRFGEFGGMFIPELLVQPVKALIEAWNVAKKDTYFKNQLRQLLNNYAGRPTPLTEIPTFAAKINGPRIFIKREDLLHTGAHKLNNALGQCLLAKRMGKTRVIAETGAGQHGVATAAAAAHLGLTCVIYMGSKDMKRQLPNVLRMQLMGAIVVPVENGSATLKDAVNEALRDWSESFNDTHYCIGSALGPYPYPEMVAEFQSIIGSECHEQCISQINDFPDLVIACIGGGSNAIGIFAGFLNNRDVKLIGVEAGGHGKGIGEHAARFYNKTKGVLHGCYTYVLQDQNGQISPTSSISAGLDYPAVGPQHSQLFEDKRVDYVAVEDHEALHALKLLASTEGIICALESAHALAYLIKIAPSLSKDQCVVVNLSGRGDKDLLQLIEMGLI